MGFSTFGHPFLDILAFFFVFLFAITCHPPTFAVQFQKSIECLLFNNWYAKEEK